MSFNSKYRVSGKNIEKLTIVSETAKTLTYVQAADGLRGERIATEKKVGAYHQWYDNRKEAVTAVLAKAAKAIKDAEEMLAARHEQMEDTLKQIENLS